MLLPVGAEAICSFFHEGCVHCVDHTYIFLLIMHQCCTSFNTLLVIIFDSTSHSNTHEL